MNGRRTAEDIEARKAINARNDAGARAWSPSRAREALRERVSRATRNLGAKGLTGPERDWQKINTMRVVLDGSVFDSERAFRTFWLLCIDNSPPVDI